jgi:galactonate dehydratase
MRDRVKQIEAHVVEVTPKTRWIFVELSTDAGLVGVGEASLNNQDGAVLAALRALGPAVFALGHAAPAPLGVPRGLAEAAALSAVDQALWDIAARRAGTSVAEALGGARREAVPLYANINRRTRDRCPEGFAASARLAVAAGFEAVKIAPFDEVAPDGPRVAGALAPGLARMAATREAIGPGPGLMVDCHWRLDAAEAEEVIRAGAAMGLDWFECPLAETADNIGALVRLRGLANDRGIRLAGCELGIGEEGFAPFLAAGAYDAMMPDVKYFGGLAGTLALADRFAAAGVAFSPHNPTGPICHAASLQVCAAAPVVDRLEVQFDETPRFAALVGGATPPIRAGVSLLPTGAGIGMRLAHDAVGELRVNGIRLEAPMRS